MLNAADTVECQISDAAMDELAGTKGTESMARQAQFLALRDAVEGIASDMFDKMPVVKGRVIRIFTKHVQKSPPSPAERIATGSEPGADNTVFAAGHCRNEAGERGAITRAATGEDGASLRHPRQMRVKAATCRQTTCRRTPSR